MLEELKYITWQANRKLHKLNLVQFCDGSVSAMDRASGLFVIKPEGIPYDELTPESFSVIDRVGNLLEGAPPSKDRIIHSALYKIFPEITSVAHFTGESVSGFGAARRPVPVFSELHAKYFGGEIPVTRMPTEEELGGDFNFNIAKTIGEAFDERNHMQIPAVIISAGSAYSWGETPDRAVMNAAYAERAAKAATAALLLSGGIAPLSDIMCARLRGE